LCFHPTIPSLSRQGRGFRIPVPRREGKGEGDIAFVENSVRMRQDIGFIHRHSRVRGNPENQIPACAGIKTWIPASAGMTRCQSHNRTNYHDQLVTTEHENSNLLYGSDFRVMCEVWRESHSGVRSPYQKLKKQGSFPPSRIPVNDTHNR